MSHYLSVEQCEVKLQDYVDEHSEHIVCEIYGQHPSQSKKTKKGGSQCGANTKVGRLDSADIRNVYPPEILRDDQQVEWCVDSRRRQPSFHDINTLNPCKICHVQHTQFQGRIPRERPVSFASFWPLIGKNYPDVKPSSWRIYVNGALWLDCYIRLIPFSSMIRNSAPSGYKHKDRCSYGKMIKMQSKVNEDIIFYVTKDPAYNDLECESEQAVVNAVGFWGLHDDDKQIKRHILQINAEHAMNVCFGFFVKNDCELNVNSIKVELEYTKRGKSVVREIWTHSATVAATQRAISHQRHQRSFQAITNNAHIPHFRPIPPHHRRNRIDLHCEELRQSMHHHSTPSAVNALQRAVQSNNQAANTSSILCSPLPIPDPMIPYQPPYQSLQSLSDQLPPPPFMGFAANERRSAFVAPLPLPPPPPHLVISNNVICSSVEPRQQNSEYAAPQTYSPQTSVHPADFTQEESDCLSPPNNDMIDCESSIFDIHSSLFWDTQSTISMRNSSVPVFDDDDVYFQFDQQSLFEQHTDELK